MKNGLVFFMLVVCTSFCLADQKIAESLKQILKDLLINENYQNAATNVIRLEQLLKANGIDTRIDLKEYYNPPYSLSGLHNIFFQLSIANKEDDETQKKILTFFATQLNPDFGFISPNEKLNIYHNLAINKNVSLFDLFFTYDKEIKTRLNQENRSGQTPLALALQDGNYHMADRFIQAGANASQEEKDLVQKQIGRENSKEKKISEQLPKKSRELVDQARAKASLDELTSIMKAITFLKPTMAQLAREDTNWSKAIFSLVERPDQTEMRDADKKKLYILITTLLEFGEFKLQTNTEGLNTLHATIKALPEITQLILEKLKASKQLEAAFAQKSKNELTPLQMAITFDRQKTADLFLKFGAAPEITDQLINLAREGSETKKYLIEQRKLQQPQPSPQKEDHNDQTEAVYEFMKQDIKMITPDSFKKGIDTLIAAEKEDLINSYALQYFLWQIAATDFSRSPDMYQAVQDSIKKLLESVQIGLYTGGFNNTTIIHEAINNGSLELVEIILEQTKKQGLGQTLASRFLEANDRNGNTPLHYAALLRTKNPQLSDRIYTYLINQGSNRAIKNKDGLTPQDIYEGKKAELKIEQPEVQAKERIENLMNALDTLLIKLVELRSAL